MISPPYLEWSRARSGRWYAQDTATGVMYLCMWDVPAHPPFDPSAATVWFQVGPRWMPHHYSYDRPDE